MVKPGYTLHSPKSTFHLSSSLIPTCSIIHFTSTTTSTTFLLMYSHHPLDFQAGFTSLHFKKSTFSECLELQH